MLVTVVSCSPREIVNERRGTKSVNKRTVLVTFTIRQELNGAGGMEESSICSTVVQAMYVELKKFLQYVPSLFPTKPHVVRE
jgi:hypothetical protein